MTEPTGASTSFVDRNRTAIVAFVTVLAVVAAAIALRGGGDDPDTERSVVEADTPTGVAPEEPTSSTPDDPGGAQEGADGTDVAADASTSDAVSPPAGPATDTGGGAPTAGSHGGAPIEGPGASRTRSRTAVPGVTDDEITVVYYWKGDRTRTSPFLGGTGSESVVDEAEAFRKLVDYVNAHADDGTTLMGHPIDLHGRTLRGIVVDAGSDPESYAAMAERITKEIQPFAAIAAHGSISAYLCPALAEAGIHNLGSYDLAGQLTASTDGYCLPAGLRWERQVDVTEGYLLRQQAEDPDRVYGVLYAEYPGLVDSAPAMVERFRRAGIDIAEVATVSPSLTTAQQQAPNVVARMRAAGVNTIVMPDAGAPLNFTNAAQAQGYNPDYYVWPCSGQDTMGMVRLFNTVQWDGAEGLTCYDEQFTSDVRNNDAMRRTEWYAAYREMAPNSQPPAPTPFVYATLLPLIAGIEGAGPDLHLESFRAALDNVRPYRYDAIEGRTDDPTNLLIDLGTAGRDVIADAIEVRYDASKTEPGSGAPGWYVYSADRRVASRSDV